MCKNLSSLVNFCRKKREVSSCLNLPCLLLQTHKNKIRKPWSCSKRETTPWTSNRIETYLEVKPQA